MPERLNILLPVEIMNRELDVRLFLACLCAREDNRIFIGESRAIRRLATALHGGIYVGQDILPAQENVQPEIYRFFKERGFRVLYLDEEGGVYEGAEERWQWRLHRRLKPHYLEAEDYVCAWGDFQRDFYKSQHPPVDDHVITTGHPRFDLYKAPYREYFAAEARRWKEQYGDFVLINTSWPVANDGKGHAATFTKRRGYDVTDPEKRYDFVARWMHLSQVLAAFVRLITRLSIDFPDVNFVIRPHPAESVTFYKVIFKGVENVHVVHEGSTGSWLFASRCMIQDGCTTGIEAHFAGTPMITYKALVDERYDLFLPNLFGARVTTEEEAASQLRKIFLETSPQEREQSAEREALELPPAAHAMNANFRTDAFLNLRDLILRVAAEIPAERTAYRPRQYATYEMIRSGRHKIRTAIRGERRREGPDKAPVFYGFDKVNLDEKMATVQRVLNRKIKYELHNSEMILMEK